MSGVSEGSYETYYGMARGPAAWGPFCGCEAFSLAVLKFFPPYGKGKLLSDLHTKLSLQPQQKFC